MADSLKAGARDSGARRSSTRTGLLLLQSSLSVVLLVGAGLFVRSVQNVRQIRLGYDVDPAQAAIVFELLPAALLVGMIEARDDGAPVVIAGMRGPATAPLRGLE